MTPVSITLIIWLLVAVALYLLVIDQLKVQVFRRMEGLGGSSPGYARPLIRAL